MTLRASRPGIESPKVSEGRRERECHRHPQQPLSSRICLRSRRCVTGTGRDSPVLLAIDAIGSIAMDASGNALVVFGQYDVLRDATDVWAEMRA